MIRYSIDMTELFHFVFVSFNNECNYDKSNFLVTASISQIHMSIDDFLGGTDYVESVLSLIDELQFLFQSNGFDMRKWASRTCLL